MSGRNPWTTRSSRLAYANAWIEVTEHDVLGPTGRPGIYGTVHFRHLAIGVVPVADDGSTWLVGQHRYPLEAYSWEIPEGGGPLDVPPLESARRELAEETGLTAAGWLEIGRAHLSNSVTDEAAVAFVAWDLTEGAPDPEDTEELAVRRLPLGEAVAMAVRGEITDALSVLALQRLALLAHDGGGPPPLRTRLARGGLPAGGGRTPPPPG